MEQFRSGRKDGEKMEKIINAQITSTSLGCNDSPAFTFEIWLKGADGNNYRFGDRCLDTYDRDMKRRIGTAKGMDFLMQTLITIGVSRWEELPGKYVRIVITKKNIQYVSVSVIGNLMKDKWLDAEKFWEEERR